MHSYYWLKIFIIAKYSPSSSSHYYRSNGSILHNLVVATQRPASGYTLNNVTSPVLYKLIHYFMENPINDTTVLKYPVEDQDVSFYLWLDSLVYSNLLPWCSNLLHTVCHIS